MSISQGTGLPEASREGAGSKAGTGTRSARLTRPQRSSLLGPLSLLTRSPTLWSVGVQAE